jgi:hypothetical protein
VLLSRHRPAGRGGIEQTARQLPYPSSATEITFCIDDSCRWGSVTAAKDHMAASCSGWVHSTRYILLSLDSRVRFAAHEVFATTVRAPVVPPAGWEPLQVSVVVFYASVEATMVQLGATIKEKCRELFLTGTAVDRRLHPLCGGYVWCFGLRSTQGSLAAKTALCHLPHRGV